MVKELRECTGAGMMECKKALVEAEGNLDAAVDILRTRGLAALAKKAGRATNEGTIAAFVSRGQQGRRARRGQLARPTSSAATPSSPASPPSSPSTSPPRRRPTSRTCSTQTISARGITVSELFGEKVSKLGENMGVARFVREEITGNGAVATYIHGGGKIGVLASFAFNNAETAAQARVPGIRQGRRDADRCFRAA